MNPAQQIENALRSPDPLQDLRALVGELTSQGHAKTEILEQFDRFLVNLQEGDGGHEADQDVIMDIMDFLVGWCSPHVKLLAEEPEKNEAK